MASSIVTPGKPYTAPTKFRTNAPWEMRKALDTGCLCKDCESFHLLRRGVTGACAAIDKITERVKLPGNVTAEVSAQMDILVKIKEILSTPSKYDTIVKCLKPCLETDKLEDAKQTCLDGNECDSCGFRHWWSNGLRNTIYNEDDVTINPESCLAGGEWSLPGIDWRYFTSVAKPTIAEHAEAQQVGDQDYNPNQSTSRNICQATKRGTLVDFLDEFETQSEKHAYHRNLVSTERRAQIDYDQNVRPLIIRRDIDFSENGTLKNKRQIQSQYWVSIGYTLFVSIASWLQATEWNKTTGELPIGAEVTIDGEFSGKAINKESFWVEVTCVSQADETMYEVTDAQGTTHMIARSRLRYRKRHSVASGHVTDDKVHDRRAMQHFTDYELKYLESYLLEYFPEDIPNGHITHLHQHSDNAASHFKNTGAINYFTTLINERGGPSETAFVYSFGAPGHGKGPFDGIGGRWKRKIDQCMSSAEIEMLEFTESGYIHTVKDVYLALEYYFGRSEKKDSQLAGRNPIHHYKFFCYLPDENPIQRPDESYSTLEGITKRYQFAVKKEGVVYMRKRSHWCLDCMDSMFKGTLDWGLEHNIEHCKKSSATENGESMYCFEKSLCTKTAGPGVAMQARVSTSDRNEIASSLTPGEFILFDTSDDELEPIWLGRIMSNPEWQGQGVRKNNSRRIMSYDGVKVGKGEVGMYVMWYEKINVVSDSLEYWVSRSETKPILQNNRYLIPMEVKMHQMLGETNIVPKLRTSTRGDMGRSSTNNERRVEDWHDKEFPIVWKMDVDRRRTALSLRNE